MSCTGITPCTDEELANGIVLGSSISPSVRGRLQSDRVLQARLAVEREGRMREGLRIGAR